MWRKCCGSRGKLKKSTRKTSNDPNDEQVNRNNISVDQVVPSNLVDEEQEAKQNANTSIPSNSNEGKQTYICVSPKEVTPNEIETPQELTPQVQKTTDLTVQESPERLAKESMPSHLDPSSKCRSLSVGNDGKYAEDPNTNSTPSSHLPDSTDRTTEFKRNRKGGSFRNFAQLKSLQKHLPKRSFRLSNRLSRPGSGGSLSSDPASGSLHKSSTSSRQSTTTRDGNPANAFHLESQRTETPVTRSRLFHILSLNNDKRSNDSSSRMRIFKRGHNYPPQSPCIALTGSSGNDDPRRGSLSIYSHVDEPIVTPFAQILASLRRVRANFITLTNVASSKDLHFGTSQPQSGDERRPSTGILNVGEQVKLSASETLEELEWCLERLENIQTHRSVSDMASSKFRKLLSKELSQFADADRKGRQISEYIVSTFLDAKEVDAGGGSPSTHSVLKDVLRLSEVDETCLNEASLSDDRPAVDKLDPIGRRGGRSDNSDKSSQSVNQSCDINALKSSGDAVDFSQASAAAGSSTVKDSDQSGQVMTDSVHRTDDQGENVIYGVHCNEPETLKELLSESIDRWGLDVFELGSLTANPLTCLCNVIFQKRGLMKRFCISECTLIRYMTGIEAKYNDVPYHNRMHASDVLQSTHVLLNAPALTSIFTDLEILSILFAAAIHDVGHPGVTNQFLINTNDQLAVLYNDSSVLENHHLAVAFSLLNQPGMDVFEHLQKKQRLTLRRMVIDMVLATDMSKHMSLLADLKTMVETKKVAGSGILTLDNYSDRMQILQNMMHCADLSNPTKPLEIYQQWLKRVMEEHFCQGDRERELGHEISPMCDRETASVEKTQVSFIDYIIHPLWETWSDLVHPDAQRILETLEENREWYRSQIVDEDTVLQEGEEENEES